MCSQDLDVRTLLLPPHLPANVTDSRKSLAKHNRVLLGEAAHHISCSQERAEGLHEDMKMWSVTQDKTLLRRLRDTRLGSELNAAEQHGRAGRARLMNRCLVTLDDT